jgi:hypothetical protein
MAKNLSEAQRRQKAKGMENTMRSDHIIKSKVKSQMSKDLETSKRSIKKAKGKRQKSKVESQMSKVLENTMRSDQHNTLKICAFVAKKPKRSTLPQKQSKKKPLLSERL